MTLPCPLCLLKLLIYWLFFPFCIPARACFILVWICERCWYVFDVNIWKSGLREVVLWQNKTSLLFFGLNGRFERLWVKSAVCSAGKSFKMFQASVFGWGVREAVDPKLQWIPISSDISLHLTSTYFSSSREETKQQETGISAYGKLT